MGNGLWKFIQVFRIPDKVILQYMREKNIKQNIPQMLWTVSASCGMVEMSWSKQRRSSTECWFGTRTKPTSRQRRRMLKLPIINMKLVHQDQRWPLLSSSSLLCFVSTLWLPSASTTIRCSIVSTTFLYCGCAVSGNGRLRTLLPALLCLIKPLSKSWRPFVFWALAKPSS